MIPTDLMSPGDSTSASSAAPGKGRSPRMTLRPAVALDPADDALRVLDVNEPPFKPDPLRPDVRPGVKTFNRDLSWLQFNARVLQQAMDERLPLLERARFLAIFTSNLDEFVMKRVGWLKRAVDAKVESVDDGVGPETLLAAVRATFEALENDQARVFDSAIRPALATEGIHLLEYGALAEDERRRCEVWFRKNVFPTLTPLAVDPGHRFPFISNLSQNLGVLVKEPGNDELHFARVKVPGGLP